MASLCQEHLSASLHSLNKRVSRIDKFTNGRVSPSPSMPGYFLRTSLQKFYSEKKAKRVYFYKNGDKFFKGLPYAISLEKCRTFGALLEDLTRLLDGLSQGVRHIYTINGKFKLTNLDQFDESGSYVCCSNDHFIKLNYGAIVAKSHSTPRKSALITSTNSFHDTTKYQKDYIKPKLVTFLRNGIKPRKVVRILLNKKTAHTFEQVLETVSTAIQLDSGVVKKLFTLGGRQVACLADFFGDEDIFIAYGPEKYLHDDFELDIEEAKHLTHSPLVPKRILTPISRQTSQSSEKLSRRPSKKITVTSTLTTPKDKLTPTFSSFHTDINEKYELGPKIGDGNFAQVFECSDRSTKLKYAIKIIDKAKCKGKEHMIKNEVSLLQQVSHPNIVQLIADFEYAENFYLILELVKGGDLLETVTKSTKFSEPIASKMIRDLASALFYLHSLNIVHRDIKPENLLVNENQDGTKSLKLADFGLATKCTEKQYMVCGTPMYVAPEILAEKGYGVEVDIWATGAIAYILLCGFPPFVSDNNDQEELFAQILAGEFVFLKPFWDKISQSVKDLIKHMLEPCPGKRFTASQVLEYPWVSQSDLSIDKDLKNSSQNEEVLSSNIDQLNNGLP